jgi:hypothetical protein
MAPLPRLNRPLPTNTQEQSLRVFYTISWQLLMPPGKNFSPRTREGSKAQK